MLELPFVRLHAAPAVEDLSALAGSVRNIPFAERLVGRKKSDGKTYTAVIARLFYAVLLDVRIHELGAYRLVTTRARNPDMLRLVPIRVQDVSLVDVVVFCLRKLGET